MPSGILTPERNLLRKPQDLIDWTTLCRMGWEAYILKKRNGLTDHMKRQLVHEFSAMQKIAHHLIPEEPVRVDNHALVYDPDKMEGKKIYSVEVPGILYLVRKMEGNVVEIYELELIEE